MNVRDWIIVLIRRGPGKPFHRHVVEKQCASNLDERVPESPILLTSLRGWNTVAVAAKDSHSVGPSVSEVPFPWRLSEPSI